MSNAAEVLFSQYGEGNDGASMLKWLISLGKIDERVTLQLDYLLLSEEFGWTPKEIDEMTVEHLQIYSALLSGKGRALDKQKSGSFNRMQAKKLGLR